MVFKSTGSKKNEPEPRSNFDMVADNRSLWVFGGTNGNHTLNDFWKLDLQSKSWTLIKTENPPEVKSYFIFSPDEDIRWSFIRIIYFYLVGSKT